MNISNESKHTQMVVFIGSIPKNEGKELTEGVSMNIDTIKKN